MTRLKKLALTVLVAGGALAGMATAAEARIVCNNAGYCWHVRNTYAYRPEYGLVVHEDNWRWGPNEHYTWREHRGRGYWRDGAWVRF